MLVFSNRRTLDVEVALELTAETFAIALTSWRQLSGLADEQRRAWLFTVGARRFGRYLRRASVERRLVARLGIDVPQATPEDIALIEQRAGLGELRTALGRELLLLSNEQQQALHLRVVEERPYDEVAATLGVSDRPLEPGSPVGCERSQGRLSPTVRRGRGHRERAGPCP